MKFHSCRSAFLLIKEHYGALLRQTDYINELPEQRAKPNIEYCDKNLAPTLSHMP